MTELILLLLLTGLFCMGVAPIRRKLLTRPILHKMRKNLPPISQTEREALEAGNTWWDAELFTGRPDWNMLKSLAPAGLSAEEQAYLEGPVETLCALLNDWEITHQLHDLPPEVWEYIKQQRFCGIIISEAIWRPGIFRIRPLANRYENRQPQHHCGGDGNGA